MRTLGIALVLALIAAVVLTARQPAASPAPKAAESSVLPQTPGAPSDLQVMKIFASAGDVQSLLAKAKAEIKPGAVMSSEHILTLAPYNANLEYRPVDGVVAVHEKEAEMVYVMDGSGSLITGGTVVGEKRTNPTNLSGTSINGGTTQAIAKGDFAIIPENTPHQFKLANGPLVLMTLHVPRPITWPQ